MPRTPPFRSEPVSGNSIKPVTRRTVLKLGGTLLLSVIAPLPAAAAQILAVRVWPAEDYTRVTLENDAALKATHFIVKDPERLVVDIEGLDLNPTLKSLVAKIQSNDPYIKQVRVGQNRPNVVRLVFDLKEEIKPQVFTLAPAGEYKHRLIFDLYPVNPVDPIAAMIEKGEWSSADTPNGGGLSAPAPSTPSAALPAPADPLKTDTPPLKPALSTPELAKQEAQKPEARADAKAGAPQKVLRMITIALDPGHGGEDPGASGNRGTHEKDIVLAIAKRLKGKLEEQPNMRVMLTRDADYFVPLGTRVDKARKVQVDLSTTAQINDSMKLAKAVLGEIGGINRLHKGAVEQAGFAVLKAPDIPSILIETAFISNPEEEARLLDDGYQDQIADAIVKGIRRYFAKNPPLAKSRQT